MLNKNKIRIMSRLAVYDKKYGVVDRKKSGYFKWDYIYFRNFWTRLGVFSGCIIISLFYFLNKILVLHEDILLMDWRYEATKAGFLTIVALVVYTIIGTLVSRKEYKQSRERLDAYFMLLDRLDQISARERERDMNGEHENYGGAHGQSGTLRYGKQEDKSAARADWERRQREVFYARREKEAKAGGERYLGDNRQTEARRDIEQPLNDNGYRREGGGTFKARGQADGLISRLKEARERGGYDDN